MTPYYEQIAKLQGQMGVAQTQEQLSDIQYRSNYKSTQRKNILDREKCNSVSRNPMDDLACSDQDYSNFMHDVGRQYYEMNKDLATYFNM